MGDTPPKVEFALGSEVSPGHFFKSSFARAYVNGSSRIGDTKSLDYDFYETNPTIVEEPADSSSQQNNFYSLVNFDKQTEQPNSSVWARSTKRGSSSNVEVTSAELSELDKLRKKCQSLTDENERLQSAVATALSQPQHAQVIESVYLQNQVNTLQWQLKQSETSRQMYRSLMEQVVRFLDRARKSLDLIHERSGTKTHNANKEKSRVPRSRSVHTVHVDSPGASSCASSTTSSTSSSSSSSSSLSSSRFSRAKSVAQISSSGGPPIKDLTWSVIRRNDPTNCTPPRTVKGSEQVAAVSAQDVSKVQDSVAIYRRPKQMEFDPDDKPPEKLSQEAFRLMRTVQSLLVMREPDLARVSPNQDSLDQHPDVMSSLHTNFANSMSLCDGTTDDGRALFNTTTNKGSRTSSQTTLLMSPGARQSIDASSLNSASSKNTEDEDRASNFNGLPKQENGQQAQHVNGYYHAVPLSSTPNNNRKVKKTDRKELHFKSLRDWALGNSNGQVTTSRPKPATSVSSAEDESGFSSMSSFQEVGLPQIPVNTLSPIKGGCHTEVGLPEVPIEKVRHRRWSSTPAEFHALFKRHSGSFANNTPNTTESLSVWV